MAKVVGVCPVVGGLPVQVHALFVSVFVVLGKTLQLPCLLVVVILTVLTIL